jgi:hypothetical protein
VRGRMGGMIYQTVPPPKRRKLRFSLRVLLILITISCLYLGCWFPTATTGVRDVYERYSIQTRPIMPLILALDISESLMRQPPPSFTPVVVRQRTRIYYFWFFGWTKELYTTRDFT